jgi:hypothetical protein
VLAHDRRGPGGGVEIEVRGESRTDVLAVPVNALLALQEGGYAAPPRSGLVLS